MAPASVPESWTALATIVDNTVSRSSVEFTAWVTSPSARSSSTERASSRVHRIEQPHILDRDHRLACESCQQCNLLVREWPHLGATNHERANGLVLPQQGNGENGPVSEAARVRAAIGELVGGGLEVVHVDRFSINEGAPSDPAAPDRRTDKIHWDRAVMSSDMKPLTLT